jgi:hypothetical protein
MLISKMAKKRCPEPRQKQDHTGNIFSYPYYNVNRRERYSFYYQLDRTNFCNIDVS